MHWRKSSYSGEDAEHNCVELGCAPGAILLRESDDPGVMITTTPDALRGLVARIKTGGFDHMAG
ncbi:MULTISPECIES: DUF397 domain-containing protein [Streptomyces violaceusniger group]|uniref:DUF397 domain-containing protein n=2 Tax=Streptomyces rhizosphaericus TaxID=114699 RepID=A0ABN1RQT4_9ACTN|nr:MULTISPECIES: DUF397 domain-containing protein [Streptomyces violaceusniger group]